MATEIVGARVPSTRPVVPMGATAERSLQDLFAETVSRHGHRLAIEADDAVLTYGELAEAVDRVAERLRAIGIGSGDRVGIRIPSGTSELYVGILGVLQAGAAYVPVDAEDPPARAAQVWESSGVCAVVEQELEVRVIVGARGADLHSSSDDDAWVIFTSGSSGSPKGVAVSHRAAVALVEAEARLWRVGPEDRVLAGLSVGFDASCEEMWLAWRHGAALVPAPRCIVRSGAEFGPWLVERRITVVSTVPTLAAMWDARILTGVRLLILGGEFCPQELGWRLAADREVWNTYGPTEATVVSTAGRILPARPITIGWPLEGWQVAVVDEAGDPVPFGEHGELVIGGVGLGRYLDSELDSERFARLPSLGWERAYRTGDTARETEDGLEFVGRCDDQVKIGGRRIELGEIDGHLRAVAGVRAAAAAVRLTAGGNKLLVGYVVGDVEPAHVRAVISERLPAGIVPLVVRLDELPTGASGKVDRRALPWPAPATTATLHGERELSGTETWLAERWADQLGPLPLGPLSDFFELGGSSLAAAKLVSAIRERFPAVAVADVYHYRRLGELAARLDQLETKLESTASSRPSRHLRWGAFQLAGILLVTSLTAPDWMLGLFSVNHAEGSGAGASLGWGWLIAGWLLFTSPVGRAGLVLLARRLLMGRVRPGRYPRHSWLAFRVTLLERLAVVARVGALAGTPMAPIYARIMGARVGREVRLSTLPPPTSAIEIGDGATIESDVDLHGWWLEGDELVIGELRIGAGARVGARCLLAPGADVGAGAEVQPGSVVEGVIPAGERWAGSPARRDGIAGQDWPREPPPPPRARSFWRVMFAVGVSAQTLLPVAAALPDIALLTQLGPHSLTISSTATTLLIYAPLFAAGYLLSYALLLGVAVRGLWKLVRPGWHPDYGATGWALWLSENLLNGAKMVLFPLHLSICTRSWLRLLGVKVGKGIEMSTAAGLSPLLTFSDHSFAADEVFYASARARGGWLHLSSVHIGRGTFLGNGAIILGGTRLGEDNLVGIETTPPTDTVAGTSWFGAPALELPRVPDLVDPARSTHPPLRLKLARSATELVRFLLPSSLAACLGALVLLALGALADRGGVLLVAAAIPFVLLGAGLCAMLLTIALKWLIMGRYRAGDHPFWSFFVWRDEIINSCQEQLAGAWLLNSALGTPLMSAYLRAMGAKVGKDVWCETFTITEFDLVELGDGCVVNRGACVMTHVVHDRLLRLGPTNLGSGSTMGPVSAVLPDTKLGEGCTLGWRSVVMRGEELPPRTRWHGSPVVSR